MKASRRWLEAFLRRPLDGRDVAARLAMLGAPVDGIEPVGADLSAFVVGLVTEVRPHPAADKLRVTTVDDGSGVPLNVVCGAPNVVAGARYPFARIGTTMPNQVLIERRKIRGEVSEGMLCSARELGLGDDHDGILTLATDAAPGTPLTQVLDAGDECLEIDVTANRGDLLGHKGIARELAASFDVPFRLPDIPDESDVDVLPAVRGTVAGSAGGVAVRIDDHEGCGRFLGGVIRGVRVGPSPDWLVARLRSVGVRSINNVVDATNYIMLELNQPLHAYDAATLRGPAVVVRAAAAGTTLVTLDGVLRNLPENALVIADADRVIGIAGVMGGSDTEVRDATSDVFLECAWFAPSRVRQARRAVGINSDAAYRFERGTDRWGASDAFRRCLRLIMTVAGGEIDGSTVDLAPHNSFPPRIFLRPARVARVLGVELPWRTIEKHLVAIGATVVSKPDDGRIAVDVPGWRSDIVAEIDLIEEIARVHGYDEIPAELAPARPGQLEDDPDWHAMRRVREFCVAEGLAEVATLPMVMDRPDDAGTVRIANPISADHGMLRGELVPSLLQQLRANWSVHTRDIRLFEVATTFSRTDDSLTPDETRRAAFVVSGARQPAHWTEPGGGRDWDRWDARGLFDRLVALANPAARVQVQGSRWIAQSPDGTVVGTAAQVHGEAPAWAGEVWSGEVAIESRTTVVTPYQAVPEFPAVTRDFALLLDATRVASDVVELLHARGARMHVESATLVDEYRGRGIPEGRRSVVVRVVFRSIERTLTDVEVEHSVRRLLASLERELGVTLRTS